MDVSYQQGLEDVAGELARMGYRMHPLRAGIPADAVLYVSDARQALLARVHRGGAAVICARGKSAGEIAALLNRRGCGELF